MRGGAVVEGQAVTVAFGGVIALHDVSFDVRDGELLGVIGPNGAGKTTLLNAITGIVPLHTGSILLNGHDVSRVPVRKRLGLGIARSFQGVELFESLSVLDNLLLARHSLMRTGVVASGVYLGRAVREERQHRVRVEEVIEFFDLQRYRHVPAGRLDFAAQKRVGIARAIASDPQVVLLDEPASGLNRDEREELAAHILRLRDELQLTLVWIEHDVQMVRDLASRVLALQFGELIGEGDPGTVLRLPRVQAAFLGHGNRMDALPSIDSLGDRT